MLKLSIIVFISVICIGCSSENEAILQGNGQYEEPTPVEIINEDTVSYKNKALEHFIDGTIEEVKGNFSNAIIEFQDAARLDPSPSIYFALAKNYFYLNKFFLALENINKAINLDSSKVDYYSLLSSIYKVTHQPDSAEAALEKIIRLDSTQLNAYYQLARINENKKPLKAIEIYEKLTKIIGPDWNVLIRIAELEDKMGNYEKASEITEHLLELDPSNESIKKLLIGLYHKAKKYDKAIKLLDDILELNKDDLDAHERKALVFIDQNKWDKAAEEYNFLIKSDKIPLQTKIMIGSNFFNQALKDSSLFNYAKNIFEQIDKEPPDWQVKLYLGAIAISQREDSIAIEYFKNVTKLARWNEEAWVRLGGLYYDNQKYDEAIKVLNEAITSFPESFPINLILGLSYTQSGKNKESKTYLKKAIDLNPNDITALSAYAFTLNILKENDEAIIYLNKALKIKPDDVNLMGTLGLIYNAQKKYELSDSVYEAALAIDSLNALINNNYAYSLSERGINLERALKMAKIAIKAEPKNSSYLDTIGWVYYKLNNLKMAKEYLQKALENGGDRPVILEHLGDVIYKLGDKHSAKSYWIKSLTLDSTNTKLKEKIDKD